MFVISRNEGVGLVSYKDIGQAPIRPDDRCVDHQCHKSAFDRLVSVTAIKGETYRRAEHFSIRDEPANFFHTLHNNYAIFDIFLNFCELQISC